jgi:hypothetical protein
MRRHFGAPWSWRVIIFTAVFGALLVGAVIALEGVGRWGVLAVLVLAAAYAVRGYAVRDGELQILHLGWATRVDVGRVDEVYSAPGITRGSIRLFGIGGVLGWIGYMRNAPLGTYWAYGTNTDNAVVLTLDDDTTLVVTPDAPAAFVETVRTEREKG